MAKVNGKVKSAAMVLIDAILVLTALSLGVYLRFDWNVPNFWMGQLESMLLPAVIINLVAFYIFGFYRRAWRYASIDELMLIVVAVSMGIGGTYLYSLYAGVLPRSSYIIAWFLLLFLIGGSRLSVRLLDSFLSKTQAAGKRQKALIVGAGEAGVMVARELKKHGPSLGIRLVGFIDDDHGKQKQIIQGVPVLGLRSDLPEVVQQKGIGEIIISMPSAPYSILQEIISQCADLPVKIKTVPGIFEIVKGQVSLKALKDVDIEDLLQRPPVKHDM